MPFACAIPLSLEINPDGTAAPVVGSGPYYIAERVPRRRIVLRRNRYYRGPRPHNVDEIVYDIGLPPATIRIEDRGGRDGSRAGAVSGRTRSSASATGSTGGLPGRYVVNPTGTIRYLAFNHGRELFGEPWEAGGRRGSGMSPSRRP